MEMFYAYMTEQILSNPDFAGRINVKDLESFMGVYMLLPAENQAEILDKIIAIVNENEANKNQLSTLFTFVSGMTNGIEVNEKNLTRLLPVLDTASIYFTVNGLSGLTDIVGKDAMTDIYAYMNENIVPKNPQLMYMQFTEVNEQNFLMVMMAIDEASKSEVYSTLVDKAVESNKTGVDTLCQVLSGTTGKTIGAEELKVVLTGATQADVSTLYLAINGVSGLVELAGEEKIQPVYKKMTEDIKTMTVNEEIFVTILSTMTEDDPAFIQLEETLYNMAPQIDANYDSVLETLDDAEKAKPASINFYAKDFESKEKIETFISDYNDKASEKDKLEYSDLVGSLMSSVTIIVNAISYVLIAFVAISLVVSSIMIGIITNISVLERTKEIGILRAIGASKKDISRVFNAETLIIGLAAGAIGIISTLILCIPITAIVQYFTGLDNIRAILPWQGAIILVVISMILTLVAGIIPARSAAKKDPVIALRTE
jgi:ABC-type antimicrobial peptide transport system permease subunit